MLSKDFKEFVGLLNANGVDFLIVGGYAMALHGRPRQTGDLDIWLDRSQNNAARLLKANKRANGRSRDLDDLQQLP